MFSGDHPQVYFRYVLIICCIVLFVVYRKFKHLILRNRRVVWYTLVHESKRISRVCQQHSTQVFWKGAKFLFAATELVWKATKYIWEETTSLFRGGYQQERGHLQQDSYLPELITRGKRSILESLNDDLDLYLPELTSPSNILDEDSVQEIAQRLPASVIGRNLVLLYSSYQHGISLSTLYRKTTSYHSDWPVLLVVRDNSEYTFGAFCSNPPNISDRFYGTGESFLFTLHPKANFFNWTGENSFFLKGDPSGFSVGTGGGARGLWIDSDLKYGSSSPCKTFSNPTLASSQDFTVQGVELWGFELIT